MMNAVLGVLYAGIVFMTCLWLYRIRRSGINLLRQRSDSMRKASVSVPIHIVLPVLDENVRLKEFTDYLLDILVPAYPGLDLWIVTTDRESEYAGSTTFQAVAAAVRRSDLIHHIHYPSLTGTMAHQLNHAIKQLPSNGLYAVYNADSRPEPDTFAWVACHYDERHLQAFQQYGLYTKNYQFLRKQRWSSILLANALWQSRWAVGFEYFRSYVTLVRQSWPQAVKPFNYCIGHGLFLSHQIFETIRFSEKTTNEDAILGIELAMNDVTLHPIPYFDIADSPDSVPSIYFQKSNWFQGPFQAVLYYRLLKRTYKDHKRLMLLCAQLFTHALYWIVGPIAVTVTIVASILLAFDSATYLALILIPLSFLVIPAVATDAVVARLGVNRMDGGTRYKKGRMLLDLMTGAPAAYAVHGLAGIRGAVFSRSILHGKKKKTAMLQHGE